MFHINQENLYLYEMCFELKRCYVVIVGIRSGIPRIIWVVKYRAHLICATDSNFTQFHSLYSIPSKWCLASSYFVHRISLIWFSLGSMEFFNKLFFFWFSANRLNEWMQFKFRCVFILNTQNSLKLLYAKCINIFKWQNFFFLFICSERERDRDENSD